MGRVKEKECEAGGEEGYGVGKVVVVVVGEGGSL